MILVFVFFADLTESEIVDAYYMCYTNEKTNYRQAMVTSYYIFVYITGIVPILMWFFMPLRVKWGCASIVSKFNLNEHKSYM